MGDLIFPEGFLWGTATAGHQVEGGNEASNWWAWEQLGRVNDGTTSGRAVDYWHRYRADHDLMVELGHGGFRLGLEWARIEPLLPRGRRGAHRVDDRRVISGIVHMLKSGARWRSQSVGGRHPTYRFGPNPAVHTDAAR